MGLSIFVLVFYLAFVSATLTFTPITATTQSVDEGETTTINFDFNISASANPDPSYTSLSWAGFSDNTGISWTTLPSITDLAESETKTLSATLKVNGMDIIGYIGQPINARIEVNDSITGNSTMLPFTLNVVNPTEKNIYDFCSLTSDSSDLTLDVDITSDGEEDNEWIPLDTINVEVKFENEKDSDGEGTYDIEDLALKLGLYKQGSSNNIAKDMIWLSEDEEKFEFGSVDEGDKAEHTFKFRINPDKIDEDGKYVLTISADGKDDNDNEVCIDYSDGLSESGFGNSVYYSNVDIKMAKDDKAMIVDTKNFEFNGKTIDSSGFKAGCEDEITIIADVWNIGDEDFDKDGDSVKVRLAEANLGLELYEVIDDSIKVGDKSEVAFSFTIPEGTEEKQYNLEFTTYYDYNEDKDEYKEQSEDSYVVKMTLEGNCALPQASIPTGATTVQSGGQAGEQLVVKTTISNTGTTTNTYALSLSGYTEWATLASLDQNSITLSPGETTDLNITLEVKKDVEAGDYSFDIGAESEGHTALIQPISVPIEQRSSLIDRIGGDDSAVTLLIGLISILALAIIITIIVKLSRKKN